MRELEGSGTAWLTTLNLGEKNEKRKSPSVSLWTTKSYPALFLLHFILLYLHPLSCHLPKNSFSPSKGTDRTKRTKSSQVLSANTWFYKHQETREKAQPCDLLCTRSSIEFFEQMSVLSAFTEDWGFASEDPISERHQDPAQQTINLLP